MHDFDNKQVIYHELEQKIRNILTDILRIKGIRIHQIESRVKDRASLDKKISRKDNKYKTLEEITDTLGLRIITYFEDDVDKVAGILKDEFEIDEKHSIDKRDKKFDEFGYSSLHYIIKLKENRAKLTEFVRFNDINFEIQIRSILQHAWAEIEHDLGYKNSFDIPIKVRRDFSRVAGLLELADQEFIRIKSDIENYKSEVETKLEKDDLEITLDIVSLEAFINSSRIIGTLDAHIAEKMGSKKLQVNHDYGEELKRLNFLGIETVDELDILLNEKRESIIKLANAWIVEDKPGSNESFVETGVSLFYLAYILLLEKGDLIIFKKYINEFRIEFNEHRLVDELFEVYNKVK